MDTLSLQLLQTKSFSDSEPIHGYASSFKYAATDDPLKDEQQLKSLHFLFKSKALVQFSQQNRSKCRIVDAAIMTVGQKFNPLWMKGTSLPKNEDNRIGRISWNFQVTEWLYITTNLSYSRRKSKKLNFYNAFYWDVHGLQKCWFKF